MKSPSKCAFGNLERDHLKADNVVDPIYRAFGRSLEELNLTLAA